MKKLCTLILVFCLSLNVLAGTGSFQELERHLDDYQYALTVEWDQRDQDFHTAQTELLFEQLEVLMSQGLNQQEMIKLVEKKMGNSKAAEAIKLKLSMMGPAASPKELANVLSENADQFYGRGASWIGGMDPMMVGGALLFAALIGYLIWFNANYECIASTQKWVCDTTHYENSSHTSCGWKTVCTQYQKKQ